MIRIFTWHPRFLPPKNHAHESPAFSPAPYPSPRLSRMPKKRCPWRKPMPPAFPSAGSTASTRAPSTAILRKPYLGRQQQEFTTSCQHLLKDLNLYLHEHGYSWKQPTRCFNRLYFHADGSIAYFLYHFKKMPWLPNKKKSLTAC